MNWEKMYITTVTWLINLIIAASIIHFNIFFYWVSNNYICLAYSCISSIWHIIVSLSTHFLWMYKKKISKSINNNYWYFIIHLLVHNDLLWNNKQHQYNDYTSYNTNNSRDFWNFRLNITATVGSCMIF